MTSDFRGEVMRSLPQAVFDAYFAVMFPNCDLWFIVRLLIRRVEVSAERDASAQI